MPNSIDTVGDEDDRVRLMLTSPSSGKKSELLIAEAWNIQESILSQPAQWSIRLGASRALIKCDDHFGARLFLDGELYPKNTPFELFVGGNLQLTGKLEGFHAAGRETRVTIRGRDALAPLMLAHSEIERSFTNGTYAEMVQWALGEAGLDASKLTFSNAANRKVKAGIPITELEGPGIPGDPPLTNDVAGAVTQKKHQNKCGESLLRFLRRHLDRAGLFLWATADGSFVLSQPNGNQLPCGTLIRVRGNREASNIVDCDFLDDAMQRHSSFTVYGRGGGRKSGRVKAHEGTVDEEMVNLGFTQPAIIRDANVQTRDQCGFFGRRKNAEARRNGWVLSYKISGHKLRPVGGPAATGQSCVVVPDTVLTVKDDELGIDGDFYVEGVSKMEEPQRETVVRLMRPNDLIFGTGGAES